jgi:hypothetical protein
MPAGDYHPGPMDQFRTYSGGVSRLSDILLPRDGVIKDIVWRDESEPLYAVAVADADFDPQGIVDDLNHLISAREFWSLQAYRGKPGPGGMENPGLSGLNAWLHWKTGELIGVEYDDEGLPLKFLLIPEFHGVS